MTEKIYRKLFFALAIVIFLLSFCSKNGVVIFFAAASALFAYGILTYKEHDD